MVVPDFEKIDQTPIPPEDKYDVFYSTFGTTRKQAGGAQGFRKIEFYQVHAAKWARNHLGIPEAHLVTSSGSDPNSFLLYPQVKGQIEKEYIDLKFPRLAIYRPAMLVGRTHDERFLEKIGVALTTSAPVDWLFRKVSPEHASIQVDVVAKAMVQQTINWNAKPENSTEPIVKIFGGSQAIEQLCGINRGRSPTTTTTNSDSSTKNENRD